MAAEKGMHQSKQRSNAERRDSSKCAPRKDMDGVDSRKGVTPLEKFRSHLTSVIIEHSNSLDESLCQLILQRIERVELGHRWPPSGEDCLAESCQDELQPESFRSLVCRAGRAKEIRLIGAPQHAELGGSRKN